MRYERDTRNVKKARISGVDHYRQGSSMFAGSACSTGAVVILGLFTFGCPACVLPIIGTFGAVFFAKALPLFGVEFKILSLVILAVTSYWLLRRLNASDESSLGGTVATVA